MLLLFGLSASPAGQLLYLIRLVPSVKPTRRGQKTRDDGR